MKLDIFCKYLIIGGVHLYLGYKGIATDSGFSGVIVAFTIATNV
jgi:hypothetical protein